MRGLEGRLGNKHTLAKRAADVNGTRAQWKENGLETQGHFLGRGFGVARKPYAYSMRQ
jgi:hypothetical protein